MRSNLMKYSIRTCITAAVIIGAALILAACENVLIDRMRAEVQEDVAIARSGELQVVSTSPAHGEVDVPLSATVRVAFSTNLDPETTRGSMLVRAGGTELSGTTHYDSESRSVIFTPAADLSPAVQYTVEVDSETIRSSEGVALSQSHSFQFTTSPRPTVRSTTPADGATEIAMTAQPAVVFDRPMVPNSVVEAISLARADGQAVAISVTYDEQTATATVVPSANLVPETTYTVTVGTGATAVSGASFAAAESFQFTVSSRPVVASTTPADGATEVQLSAEALVVFDRPMQGDTVISAVSLARDDGQPVSATVSYDDQNYTATITPDDALNVETTYVISVSGDATGVSGASLAAGSSYEFTTVTRPEVSSITPADGATEVVVDVSPTVVFDRQMEADTVQAAISLAPLSGTSVGIGVTYNDQNRTATVVPDAPLAPATTYVVTVGTGATATTGARLAAEVTSQFTVAARPAIVSTSPSDGTTTVPVTVNPEVVFDGPMESSSVISAVSLVDAGGSAVAGTVTYNSSTYTATIATDADLATDTTYDIVVAASAASVSGATLGTEQRYEFTTDFYTPGDIAVTVGYGGPYELNAQYPLYLELVPNPYSPGDTTHVAMIDGPGSVVISEADLPASSTGEYWLVFTHLFKGTYENFFDSSAAPNTGGLYHGESSGNFTSNFSSTIQFTGEGETAAYEAVPGAVLLPGNSYNVTFTDTELVSPDMSEPNEDWRDADTIPELGPAYSRTMGWDDTDWYEFVPDTSDEYRFVVAEEADSPYDESSLRLDFPVQLSVFRYESGSDDISHKGSDYDDSGIDSDNYGLVDTSLIAGETYFVQITSTARADVGDYKIKIVPTEVALDSDEPGNDTYVAEGGTEIPFGRNNSLSRSLHQRDTDYFWIDNTGLNLPGSNFSTSSVFYVIETVRPDLENVQDFNIGISVREGSITGGSQFSGEYPSVILPNSYDSSIAEARREVRVTNESFGSYYDPTGEYQIRFGYGPDYWDWDASNETVHTTRDNTIGATSAMDNIAAGDTTYHSIYDTTDVDYIRVWTGTATHLTIDLSVPQAYLDSTDWNDDFFADMDIIAADQSSEIIPNASANGEGSPEVYVGEMQNNYIYLKLYRASNSPLPTGAYKIEVTDTSQ
jgi:hypothetical protein